LTAESQDHQIYKAGTAFDYYGFDAMQHRSMRVAECKDSCSWNGLLCVDGNVKPHSLTHILLK